jgi:allophanate hydrolase subunit 2
MRIDSRWIDPRPTLDFSRAAIAQVLPGRDPLQRRAALFDAPWRVAAASDRQGLRLEGDALTLAAPREMISEPLVPGTIQLPPEGGPIVLLADAQTVGGYPVIGTVASADLPRLAQCRPGDVIHLRAGDLATARREASAQSHHLARIEIALATRT